MTLAVADLQRLSTLLDQALDLSADDRLRWLDALPEDARPLAGKLRELLARHAEMATSDFASAPAALGVEPSSRLGAPAAGAPVGPYRLLRELGSGGMGAVWLAERADGHLRRKVALKLPHLGWSAGLADRFAREREILATLEHPHIARLYDAGVDDLGRPYMALEYVEGRPIDQYCREHGLDVAARLRLLLQVAEAVAFAHSRLVLHRDLKPANILVTEQGQVRLLDFGIAKLMEGDRAHETALTQAAGRALTLDYASPEQIRGEPIGTASDVYSLGVVAFELLTGNRPYRLKRGTAAELEEAIASADLPLASSVADAVARKERLRGDLDAILNKALKKEPAQRYATVDALAQDLQRHLAGRPVLARPDSVAYRLSRFGQRHRVTLLASGLVVVGFGVAIGIGATALVTLALAAGLGVALWQVRVARRERDRALRMVDRAEAVQSFLNTVLTDAARGGQPLTAEQLLRRSEQLVAQELGEGPEVLALVLSMIGTSMQTLGNSAEAIRLGERALELARDSGDADLLDGLRAHYALAIGWAGRYAEARRILLDVLSRRGALLERRTEAHHYLALLSGGHNEPGDALHHAEAALRCLRAQRHPPRKLEASLLMSLGIACSLQGRMAEADRHFAAAFARVQSLGQERTPQAVTLLNNWAVVNERAGDARRMLELAEQALALAGPDGVSPFLLINRGRALEHLGRLDEAAVAYSQGERLASERRMPPPQINALLGQASVALRQGRVDAARDALAEADRAGAAQLPTQHPQSIQRALVAGRCALAVDDVAQAAAQFDRALQAAPRQASAVTAQLGLVEVALTRGEPACAVEHARAALELAQTLQGGKGRSFRTALAGQALARALVASGDAGGAARQSAEAAVWLEAAMGSQVPAPDRADPFAISRKER